MTEIASLQKEKTLTAQTGGGYTGLFMSHYFRLVLLTSAVCWRFALRGEVRDECVDGASAATAGPPSVLRLLTVAPADGLSRLAHL